MFTWCGSRRVIASAGFGRTVSIWDPFSPHRPTQLLPFVEDIGNILDHRVCGICCCENEDMLICTSVDRKIKVFDLRMGRMLQSTTDWEQQYHSTLYYDEQYSRIFIAGSQIRCWNVKYIMGEKIDSPFSSVDVMQADKVQEKKEEDDDSLIDLELQIVGLLYSPDLHIVYKYIYIYLY